MVKSDRRKSQRLDPTERAYKQMLQVLSEQGMPKANYKTPQEYADQVRAKVSPEQAAVVISITQAYQDWYYGDRPISATFLTTILRKLKRMKFRN